MDLDVLIVIIIVIIYAIINSLGIGLSRACLLRRRKEKQIEQMHILHQHHAQLVQQNHQSLLDVRGKDFALARAQQLEQWSQKGFVHEHLVARVTDQQFVQL